MSDCVGKWVFNLYELHLDIKRDSGGNSVLSSLLLNLNMCCGYSKGRSLLSTHNHICNIERRYVHDVLINHLVKFAQEVRLGVLTIAVVDWEVKHQTKQIFEPPREISNNFTF